MAQLFDDSDSEIDLKTNNDYAKNYDTWRKKEEFNKLKTKYGEVELNIDNDESSSSSEDDETGIELTEEVEKDFYKTLSLLKKKDPKIYDDKAVFFEKSSNMKNQSQKKKVDQNETMYIKDYERKLLLEKGGIVSDSDEETRKGENEGPTYVEEQKKLKEILKKAAHEEDSDNEDWGGMFKVRQENKEEKEKEEAEYKAWLAGQKKKIEDEETATSLKPLRDYWGDPNLEDGEKFLRDYILNKRYLENENEDYIPTYDEIVHDSDENLSEDETAIIKQEEFEHKYNFRFEEPDQEFIKRFPRTMENSLRKEDNRRKLKRVETKERKAKEKSEKMEELKKLRDLKRKEIEEKIEKLKEITGNKEMAFNDEDIDGDFDPEAHDKRMQALFNDDYYEGPEEDQKPKLDSNDEADLDLEIENFDNWTRNDEVLGTSSNYEPHCEDEDFIMDADYDPQAVMQKELIENTKKKKRRRKSKFVEMLAKDRPKFDIADKTYEEYIDEYYKLDCEDIIDNIPCRFKYRKVPANSFGLTVEEILVAKDRELNKWCSLKKSVQIRPDNVEKYDQIAYSRKANNIALKKKLLPSLFMAEEEEMEQTKTKVEGSEGGEYAKNNKTEVKIDEIKTEMSSEIGVENVSTVDNGGEKKKRKKSIQQNSSLPVGTTANIDFEIDKSKSDETNNSKKNDKEISNSSGDSKYKDKNEHNEIDNDNCTVIKVSKKKKNKKKFKSVIGEVGSQEIVENDNIKIENTDTNKYISKDRKDKNNSVSTSQEKIENSLSLTKKDKKRKKKKNSKIQSDATSGNSKAQKRKHNDDSTDGQGSVKKFKKNKCKSKKDKPEIGLSDARLAAYGLNPKKFKNKLIYGNKNKNK